MMRPNKVSIKKKNKYIDVTEKTAIIYNISDKLLEYLKTTPIQVCALISDSEKLIGQNVLIGYKQKTVLAIGQFRIDRNKHYVITDSYKRINIKNGGVDICNLAAGDSIVYRFNKFGDSLLFLPKTSRLIRALLKKKKVNKTTIYPTIDEFLNSPSELCKLISNNTLQFKEEIKDIFLNNLKSASWDVKNVTQFYPLPQGRRNYVFAFVFGDAKYVFRLPYARFMLIEENSRIDNTVISKFNSLIVAYESKYDSCILNYADSFPDFKNESTVAEVLDVMSKLHQEKPIGISSYKNIVELERISYSRIEDFICEEPYGAQVEHIHQKLKPIIKVLERHNKSVIHGDLHPGNIVLNDGKVAFIDWDAMGDGDCMRDVCFFLFRTFGNVAYSRLKDDLTKYYKRIPTLEEYIHAVAMLFFQEWYDITRTIMCSRKDKALGSLINNYDDRITPFVEILDVMEKNNYYLLC